MPTQNYLDPIIQQVDNLSDILYEEISDGFKNVISTEEGKEILKKTYREELIGLWEKLPNLENEAINREDLESFILECDTFLHELKKSIQYPHRQKVNSQFLNWQRRWEGENIPWLAFLENCTDEDLNQLDSISQNLNSTLIQQSIVSTLIDRWVKNDFATISKMEKTGPLLIEWAKGVLENFEGGNRLLNWLNEIRQTANNLSIHLSSYLACKWIEGKVKILGAAETFPNNWKISSYYQNWSVEWKNFLEKLQNLKPILPSLNQQEIALFEKYYRYLDINIDVLENIKKDVQNIITYRESLDISELADECPKLVQPFNPEVKDLLKSTPKFLICIPDNFTPEDYIIHLRSLHGQVPVWQAEFKRVSGKLSENGNSWYLRSENRKIPKHLSEIIEKMVTSCTHIETLAGLIRTHNYLVDVEEEMKPILTAELGEFTSRLFREINSRLDQSNSIPVDELLSLHPGTDVEQALFNLVRQNLIKLEIRR